MPQQPNVAEILRDNPQIDPNRLRESMELLEELNQLGVSSRGYQLNPPFEGRQAETATPCSEERSGRRF